jgi:hypothetical protein
MMVSSPTVRRRLIRGRKSIAKEIFASDVKLWGHVTSARELPARLSVTAPVPPAVRVNDDGANVPVKLDGCPVTANETFSANPPTLVAVIVTEPLPFLESETLFGDAATVKSYGKTAAATRAYPRG